MKRLSEFTIDLTSDQIRFFHENGYLSIDRVTTDEEVAWLREIYDEVFRRRAGSQDGRYVICGEAQDEQTGAEHETMMQVTRPEKEFPELLDTVYYANGRKIAAALLEVEEWELNSQQDPELNGGGNMILKPAVFGRDTPWHQDEAYCERPEYEMRSVSIWMPLDPATVESGCMQFIPGSHREGIKGHQVDFGASHMLGIDGMDLSRAVACPLAPGGATIHHCRILHYTAPNTTSLPRRAYVNVFNAPPTKLDAPQSRPWLARQSCSPDPQSCC